MTGDTKGLDGSTPKRITAIWPDINRWSSIRLDEHNLQAGCERVPVSARCLHRASDFFFFSSISRVPRKQLPIGHKSGYPRLIYLYTHTHTNTHTRTYTHTHHTHTHTRTHTHTHTHTHTILLNSGAPRRGPFILSTSPPCTWYFLLFLFATTASRSLIS